MAASSLGSGCQTPSCSLESQQTGGRVGLPLPRKKKMWCFHGSLRSTWHSFLVKSPYCCVCAVSVVIRSHKIAWGFLYVKFLPENDQAAAEMKGLVNGTCPSRRGISEWLQCGGELKRDLLWAAGEMLQLMHYLRPMFGPQVTCVPAVSPLNNVCLLLDEGFMCKAWCFRAWVELVARALFCPSLEQPTCSTGWTVVCWNVLKFVCEVQWTKIQIPWPKQGLFQIYSFFLV